MGNKKRVLAILGSTRENSVNLNLIQAITSLCILDLRLEVFSGIAELPHFNPDLDTNNPPKAVANFRKQLKDVDGILICTPEYAMGVPGSLKNAIDWAVSSCEFSNKSVALITASTSGQKAHESLLATLNVIEAKVGEHTQLIIPFAKTKINDKNEITDSKTLLAIQNLLSSFIQSLNN